MIVCVLLCVSIFLFAGSGIAIWVVNSTLRKSLADTERLRDHYKDRLQDARNNGSMWVNRSTELQQQLKDAKSEASLWASRANNQKDRYKVRKEQIKEEITTVLQRY